MRISKLKIEGGFTVAEMVVVIAIGLIVFSIVVNAFLGLRDTQALNSSVEKVVSVIYDSRQKTLSSQGAIQYGVHFQNDRVVFFEGAVYSSSSPSNKVQILSDRAEISSISLNGAGFDIIFERLTGKTDQFGSVILRLKNNISKTRQITVNSAGIIR